MDINVLISLVTLVSAIGGAGYWIAQVEKRIEDRWESELAELQKQIRARHDGLSSQLEKIDNKLQNHVTRYEGERNILTIKIEGLAGKVKSKHQDLSHSIDDIIKYLMTAPQERPFVKRPRQEDTIGDDWTLGS